MERRVLLIDDDRSMLETLRAELERSGFEVTPHTSPEEALRELAERDFGVVLSDVTMGAMSGVDVCREVVLLREDTPVVLMTAYASMESAIASIRAGAYDFVTKPFEPAVLVVALERALLHHELRQEVKRLRRAVGELQPFGEMLGESAVIKAMSQLIARVAESDATVLVTGESGTGKELVARALHARSSRASGPFVAINCAAVPETLLESELFGHVRGAFTDARVARTGLFVKASGGTLFLDEIGEMPMSMQAKLLRALQERTVRPVGGDVEVPFRTRIVAATNRDLEHEVEQKRFREDLFYRVNVVRIEVPPLRVRENDVLLLAQSFLQHAQATAPGRVAGIKSVAAARLLAYPWPGNVRELQNCMQRAVALAQFDQIGVDDLPERIGHYKASPVIVQTTDPEAFLPMDEVERRYVVQVLDAHRGKRISAARVLGMDRRTLYRKLERWAKDVPSLGDDGAPGIDGRDESVEEEEEASALEA